MVINDVYIPYLNNKSRTLVLYGGGSSGKSVFAAQKIIARCKSEKPHKFLALRKVGATIKDSIFAEIKNVIYQNDLEREFQVNKSEYYFTHIPTGNQILCKGLDEPEKIKSIQGITGMWVEETTEFTKDDLDQLNIRIRGKKEHYVQFIYSFNPISEDNYVVKKFIIDKDYQNATVLHTTYKSNYFLSEEDKQELENYKETNSLFYDVYCLGLPGKVDTSNKFLYSFVENNHTGEVKRDKNHPVRLSFDFNIDPYATVVYQRTGHKSIRIFDYVRLSNSDIEQVCDQILVKYPNETFNVTGDVSGKNRSGVVRGKRSHWQVIRERLKLRDQQIRLRSRNLDLVDSRLLCNQVFTHCDVLIDKSLENLINDCKFAKVDDHGVLIKDRNKQKNDFLDCLRYICDAEFPDIIVNHKKYK